MKAIVSFLDELTPLAFGVLTILSVAGLFQACSGQNALRAKNAEIDAACAATRALYKETRQKLWTGPCVTYDTATDCPSYIVLRESFIVSLEKLNCPTEPE